MGVSVEAMDLFVMGKTTRRVPVQKPETQGALRKIPAQGMSPGFFLRKEKTPERLTSGSERHGGVGALRWPPRSLTNGARMSGRERKGKKGAVFPVELGIEPRARARVGSMR